MLEKMVPIPPEFYDDHKDDDLITGKGTIFPFAVFLYFMQWAAFLGFILFYWYHPSFQVMQSKMENNYDYGKASGWNCTPLINDPFYKSRMNYETCKEIMIKPKLDDIKTLKINGDKGVVVLPNFLRFYLFSEGPHGARLPCFWSQSLVRGVLPRSP